MSSSAHGSLSHGGPYIQLFCQFSAFVLLLLVSLSTPIIKSVYILILSVNVDVLVDAAHTSVKFGVWGYCYSGVTNTVKVGPFGPQTIVPAKCSPKGLGWTFKDIPIFQGISDSISKEASALFVLHAVACGITALALTYSLFLIFVVSKPKSRPNSDVSALQLTLSNPPIPRSKKSKHYLGALLASFFAAFTSLFLFIVDIAVVSETQHKVKKDSLGTAKLGWGPAVWLVLASVILLLISSIAALNVWGGWRPCTRDPHTISTESRIISAPQPNVGQIDSDVHLSYSVTPPVGVVGDAPPTEFTGGIPLYKA